jgi:uncharacterized membrane protein YeiH
MGVITGVFGGLLRDVLTNEVPLVFTSELYATASWRGALVLMFLQNVCGMDVIVASSIAMGVVVVIRLAALHWHIRLPRLTSDT